MKKTLLVIVSLAMFNVFAHEGTHKHMISFGPFESNNSGSQLFDIDFSDDDSSGEDLTDMSVALNYTYAINPTWMIGGRLIRSTEETSGNTETKKEGYGIHAYYNLDHRSHDTWFAGVHYYWDETEADGSEDIESNTLSFEYGKRFSVGMWKELHLQFSPSVAYSIVDTEQGTNDQTKSEFSINFLRFDLLF